MRSNLGALIGANALAAFVDKRVRESGEPGPDYEQDADEHRDRRDECAPQRTP